ncbi:MAG: COX15/CtaA family protein [Sphingomonadaceae bacterium]
MPAGSTRPATARPLALSWWLWSVAALVVIMVAVGGITRLTESGLSITEWKPVSGALPPLSEADWQAEFAAYKQIPQYTQVNGPAGMTLEDYKFIFFWEWFHRLIGRTIGLAFALPLAWFWVRKAIPAGFKPRLIGLLALGGLQGAVGWWMVTSGLSQDVKVSHFRLAVHLMLALLTLACLAWTALDLRAAARGEGKARMTGWGGLALGALALQLAYGALLAGLRAGPVAGGGWFNWQAWPLMQGLFVPAGIDWSHGAVHAFLNDPYLVHFTHRWWAWVVVAILIVLARRLRPLDRRASIAIHSAFGTQILLGIATVMSGIALWLAALHQLTGALLVLATTWGAHRLGRTGSAK